MLLTSLSTVAAGFAAAAAVAMIAEIWPWLRSTGEATGKARLAGPLIGAGLAMLCFQVWSTYSWFETTAEDLPPTMVVAETLTRPSPLTPWTMAAPPVERFAAVDRASILRIADAPSLAVADVTLIRRFGPTVSTRQIYDCITPQRVDAGSPTEGQAGVKTVQRPADWVAVDPNDPIRRIVCEPIVSV